MQWNFFCMMVTMEGSQPDKTDLLHSLLQPNSLSSKRQNSIHTLHTSLT